MRDSIYRITLDVHRVASQIQVSAKHHDRNRSMEITLMENGDPYIIADGCKANLVIKRPDGYVAVNTCSILTPQSKILYDFTFFATSVVGIYDCELRLTDAEDELLTSPRFTILVDETIYEEGEKQIIYHSDLASRDLPDQHPMSAISGLEEWVNKEEVTSYATASPFAQLPQIEGYNATVFDTQLINGVKYGIGLYNTSDDANQVARVYNLTTGEMIAEKNYTLLGHSNDVTYVPELDSLVVASMRLDNTISVVPWNGGSLGNATDVDLGLRSFGVGYNKGLIYVICSNDEVRVYDKNWNYQKSIILKTLHKKDVVYQSIYVDDSYIYRINGIKVRGWTRGKEEPYQAIDSYTKDGEFYKRTLVPIQYEMESITRMDDDFYLCCASTGIGLIYKANVIETDKTYGLLPARMIYPGPMESTGVAYTNYIDENYKGFFMDGMQEHPFSKFWHGFELIPDWVNDARIVLLSDLTTNIQIKRSMAKYSIDGRGHSVPGFYTEDVQYLKVSNMKLTQRNTTRDALFASLHTKTVDLSGIDFDGEAYNSVYFYGGDLHVENCTFSKKATSVDLNILSGASLVLRSNTYNVDVELSNQGISYLNIAGSDAMKFLYNCVEFNNNVVLIGDDIEVNQIRLGGKYMIESGAHPKGMPAGVNFKVMYVRPVSRNNIIFEATAANGDFYMAHSADGVIKKWINVRNPEDVIEINKAELENDMKEVYG